MEKCTFHFILFFPFTDVDECEEQSIDCQHTCINTVGSYHCECHHGFSLRPDNHTCEPDQHAEVEEVRLNQAGTRDRCFASCDTVARLHDKLNNLHEKVQSNSSHSSQYYSSIAGKGSPVNKFHFSCFRHV
jgi:hypothetical protein